MMSASSSLPSFSRMPFLVKVSICSVTTEARLSRDRLEQVAVGHQAQPLVPGIVARREMRGDVVVRPERHLDAAEDQLLDPRPACAWQSWKKYMPNSTLRQRIR